ncbi:hypothetical protein BAUCODRAFT_25037 [Baudoinia panamericana UAMH 10762]|uniref:Uncharacterized protein n=1 Tax=Baudoinia panamericana (strain UAMH 10762) TaxID=717646 RepID=M2LNY8_BAUPA|nr:uncharacterized protein BAUCODRAFT_25037 [Baudoinia panamericana UAMH 10762]EMC96092.1 hypothetical protein BAUCODRAFT_25037 [Baudoinia panamericana UAMH 10762]
MAADALAPGSSNGMRSISQAANFPHEGQAHQLQPAGLGIRPSSSAQTQSIDTRLWTALNDFARKQDDGTASTRTSDLPSTACPSISGEPRLSSGRMLFDSTALPSMAPPIIIPPSGVGTLAPAMEDYSATEIATPSLNGTPDLRAFAVTATRAPPDAPEARHDVTSATAQPAVIVAGAPTPIDDARTAVLRGSATNLSIHEMRNMLQTLSRRVEVLESQSFAHVAPEDVHDRFEHHSVRLSDLEQWQRDTDTFTNHSPLHGPSNSKRRRLSCKEDASVESDESFDSAAAAQTEAAVLATIAVNAETGPRIDALEGRISDLENAALPSFARPWHVQVVLLPWGRNLRGIWFSACDATQHSLKSSTQASDEWLGPESAPRLSFQASSSHAWTTESIEAWAADAHEWLSPKACGPSGTVFKRLASRGLVQDITLTSASSQHIIDAISTALNADSLGEDMQSPESVKYQALGERFVPLRKVRKSSRLRFLSPAEMVTSATWTAGWLDSSVCMKVTDGQRRLYVTTPEAYTQRGTQGSTWPGLRRLPIYDAHPDEQAAQATNAVIEACWTYNDRLDQASSAAASFAMSHESRWNTHSQLSPDAYNGSEPTASDRPDVHQHSVGHHRAVSMPSSASIVAGNKASLPKRRVASFNLAAPAQFIVNQKALDGEAAGRSEAVPVGQILTPGANKRRRTSITPEAERRGVGFTPRMSREPPSPYTSEHVGDAQSQLAASRKRGTTPSAYATPHSNNTYIGRPDFSGEDGDTEADTVLDVPPTDQGDDEWHGVDTGADPDGHSIGDDSVMDEAGTTAQ